MTIKVSVLHVWCLVHGPTAALAGCSHAGGLHCSILPPGFREFAGTGGGENNKEQAPGLMLALRRLCATADPALLNRNGDKQLLQAAAGVLGQRYPGSGTWLGHSLVALPCKLCF